MYIYTYIYIYTHMLFTSHKVTESCNSYEGVMSHTQARLDLDLLPLYMISLISTKTMISVHQNVFFTRIWSSLARVLYSNALFNRKTQCSQYQCNTQARCMFVYIYTHCNARCFALTHTATHRRSLSRRAHPSLPTRTPPSETECR